MEKLKSYISALIEAVFKKKSAYIANQGMPVYLSSFATEYSYNSVAEAANVIAPYDSYATTRIIFNNEGTDTTVLAVGKRMFSYFSHQGNTSMDCIFPLRKGNNISISATDASKVTSISITFYKLVGGGLTALLRKLFGTFGEVQYA